MLPLKENDFEANEKKMEGWQWGLRARVAAIDTVLRNVTTQIKICAYVEARAEASSQLSSG